MRAAIILSAIGFIINVIACSPKPYQSDINYTFNRKDSTLSIRESDSSLKKVYDENGNVIFGRKVIHRDLSASLNAVKSSTQSGKVAVKICVNRAGLVTYTELISEETTITDEKTLKDFLRAARNYKIQPDETAPPEQCGKITFKIDNMANSRLRN